MSKYLYWNEPQAITNIEKMLRLEKIILGTSDTVIGLLAFLSSRSFELLNQVKKRENKPYLVLIGSKEKSFKFTDSTSNAHIATIMENCWPGPVTLIVKAKASVDQYIKSQTNTVALRVPNHTGLQQLLTRFDGLFSTSANLTGEPIPQTIQEVDPTIFQQVAYIVTDKDAPEHKARPSTILDCSGDTIKVIREGAYPVEKIEKIVGFSLKKNL